VDSKQEILASKLATLLERSEIRDLADVKALLDAGGIFRRGCAMPRGRTPGSRP
jgi:hypothetical protein